MRRVLQQMAIRSRTIDGGNVQEETGQPRTFDGASIQNAIFKEIPIEDVVKANTSCAIDGMSMSTQSMIAVSRATYGKNAQVPFAVEIPDETTEKVASLNIDCEEGENTSVKEESSRESSPLGVAANQVMEKTSVETEILSENIGTKNPLDTQLTDIRSSISESKPVQCIEEITQSTEAKVTEGKEEKTTSSDDECVLVFPSDDVTTPAGGQNEKKAVSSDEECVLVLPSDGAVACSNIQDDALEKTDVNKTSVKINQSKTVGLKYRPRSAKKLTKRSGELSNVPLLVIFSKFTVKTYYR